MGGHFSMVGTHAFGKRTQDAIFTAGARAADAVNHFGQDRIVNATVGLILDDREQLVVLSSVMEVLRSLTPLDYASYSPFLGSEGFRTAVKEFTFGSFRPEAYTEAVATPGSTGALRNTFWNYLDLGDPVLVPDWRWSPYDTIAGEHLRQIVPYDLFDSEQHYSLHGIERSLQAAFERHSRAVVVINDPCQNPTGYDLGHDEWAALMELLRRSVRDSSRRLVLFIDAPYLDFAAEGDQAHGIFQRLLPLPQNLLVTIGYSISKSLTQYGLRVGALIGMSSDRGVMTEFCEVNGTSARAVWTNVPRAGMRLCEILHQDPRLKKQVTEEREVLRRMLSYRASVFLEEAEEVGLVSMPYRSGFFISVPSPDPVGLANTLAERQIFVVPMPQGIRIAISGIPARKISGIAGAVQDCVRTM